MTKKIIISVIIIGLISFALYRLLKKEETPFTLFEVVRGDIVQELWETGRVQKGERINLGFKNAGKIEEIYVRTNQEVEKGQILAKLEATDLNIQLQTAQNSLELAKLNLQKLLAGARPEEIKIAETQVENAKIGVEEAQKNLVDKLRDAYTKSDDAVRNYIDNLFLYPQTASLWLKIPVKDGSLRIKIEQSRYQIENSLNKWQISINALTPSNLLEPHVTEAKSNLNQIFDLLNNLALAVNTASANGISQATLDTYKTYVSTARTNLNTAIAALTAAEEKMKTSEAVKILAENELALKKAGARQIDIDLYEAQIEQARNQVRIYENQIENSILRSPVKGLVASVNKRKGETAMIQDTVISLLPAGPFEIVADIYEERIVKLTVGDPVKITLPAFPDKSFTGKIISIDETEKIINGVIYYEIKIAFNENPPEGIKPTMTVDIVIQTDKKENVLVIPKEAVRKTAGKTMVEVLVNGLIQKKQVETGLTGDSLIEIISGLNEGDKIVIR